MKTITDVVMNTYGVATYSDGSVEPFMVAYANGIQIDSDSQSTIDDIVADPNTAADISNILGSYCVVVDIDDGGGSGGGSGGGGGVNEIWEAQIFYWVISDSWYPLSIYDNATNTRYYGRNDIVAIGNIILGWDDGDEQNAVGNAMVNGTAYRGYKFRMVGNNTIDAPLPADEIGLDNMHVEIDWTNPRRPILNIVSDVPFDQFSYYDQYGGWIFLDVGVTAITFNADLNDGIYWYGIYGIRDNNYQWPACTATFNIGNAPLYSDLTVMAYPEEYGVTGINSFVFNTGAGEDAYGETQLKDLGPNPETYTTYDFDLIGWANCYDPVSYFD